MANGLIEEKVVVKGRTFRIRENGWGNVYGYAAGRRVEMFWGSNAEQIVAARAWLDTRTSMAATAEYDVKEERCDSK